MLVKLTDLKGKDIWVNPLYVKSLTPKRDDETHVEVSGWALKMKVPQNVEDVALTLNAAMPEGIGALVAAEEDLARQRERQSAG